MSREMDPVMVAFGDARKAIGALVGDNSLAVASIVKLYRDKALGSMNYADLDKPAKLKAYKDAVELAKKDSNTNHAKHLADAKAKMKKAREAKKKAKASA